MMRKRLRLWLLKVAFWFNNMNYEAMRNNHVLASTEDFDECLEDDKEIKRRIAKEAPNEC